jgi:hypothetical protein
MNTQQIIEAVKALPIADRLKLIQKLTHAAAIDADHFSSGREGSTEAYDALLAEPQPEPTLAQTYAATAEKAITPDSMNKEVVTGAGLQEKQTDNA